MRHKLRVVLPILLSPGTALAQTNYFGSSPAAPAPESAVALPDMLRGIVAFVAETQRTLIDMLTSQTGALTDGASPGVVAAIIGFAFLYGVFHAAGPGHGKFVIATYLATHQERARRGVGMAVIMAGSQALSAIVIVSLIAVVLRAASGVVLESVNVLEGVSYGLIVLIGLGMAYRTILGKPHRCALHDHGHHHDHHHHHDHDHDHAHHGRRWLARWMPEGPARSLAAAVGVRPCSGAIIILLFTLANGLFLVGIIATVMMAVGVALTVSGIGLGAILARWSVGRLAVNRPGLAAAAGRTVAMVGSLFLVVAGTLLLLGVAVRSGFAA